MKKITILGSTGSIGTQALDIIASHPDQFCVGALSCGKNVSLLKKQIRKFRPELVAVAQEEDAGVLATEFPQIEILYGQEGLIQTAQADCDIVLNALMGINGLRPTYHAIRAGHDIALANKETLVAGGRLIMKMAQEYGVKLLPVDSEHSAIFQCMQGNSGNPVRRILLTASGGPFRGYTPEQLEHVTLEQALNHPKWDMGNKITIDSATLMNKGLEVIEARWLFDLPLERIRVVVHPQSIVHSAVEYEDGSVIAQMGQPDMRIPISYAFGYPKRIKNDLRSLDLFGEGASLTFEKPDERVFRTLGLAYEASRRGGTYPAVLNGANEALVQLFLERKIRFTEIQSKLAMILEKYKPHAAGDDLDLEEILEADRQARQMVFDLI